MKSYLLNIKTYVDQFDKVISTQGQIINQCVHDFTAKHFRINLPQYKYA